jgi:cell wall-associated NlpC family hydrolase
MNSLLRGVYVFLVLTACLLITGCGSSSPRFATHEPSQKEGQHEQKNSGPRFSSKHIEEEKKEDDKKVDTEEVIARFRSQSNSSSETQGTGPESESSSGSNKISEQKMMSVILGYLGTPYRYGGDTKEGIDCSAFTQQVYKKSVQTALPRSATEQMQNGSEVSRNQLKFGDLIFFNTTGTNPSHVGIYIGDDLFAHASEAFGVTISSLESTYYKERYTGARRIIQ